MSQVTFFQCGKSTIETVTLKVVANKDVFEQYAKIIKKTGRTTDEVFLEAMRRVVQEEYENGTAEKV